MEKLGKITVKHFLNTALSGRGCTVSILDEKGNPCPLTPLYPIYVKITFMRKTTQQKSIINEDFATMEEAYGKYRATLAGEARMIEDVIRKEYQQLNGRVELRGLAKKCEVYKKEVVDLIFEDYLWGDFAREVLKSRTGYMRLLLQKFPRTPAMEHYNAALKLIGDRPGLLRMRERFESYAMIERCLPKAMRTQGASILDWHYGDLKDRFSLRALQKGYSFKQTSKVVALVDSIIADLLER
ncbi:MAG: hypothetical protein HOO91_19390 [Bacteroidales bacterium]|nr:hypothetical protein [Bacteroidales bacterium]